MFPPLRYRLDHLSRLGVIPALPTRSRAEEEQTHLLRLLPTHRSPVAIDRSSLAL